MFCDTTTKLVLNFWTSLALIISKLGVPIDNRTCGDTKAKGCNGGNHGICVTLPCQIRIQKWENYGICIYIIFSCLIKMYQRLISSTIFLLVASWYLLRIQINTRNILDNINRFMHFNWCLLLFF